MTQAKSLHLIERAAERLRQDGALDPSAAQLLGSEQPPRPAEPGPPKPAGGPAELAPRARPPIEAAILERAGMIDWSKTRNRVAEELRIVQAQILRAAFSPEAEGAQLGNLVMVTSARPGEGKSFAALNLGASIARGKDHQVLLVDVDPSRIPSPGRSGCPGRAA
jgi:protein-tyrosine kinase